jgi:cytochrome c5
MKKLCIIIGLSALASFAQATDNAVADLYNKSCIACHSSGAAGAPKTGAVEQWQGRLKKGMDVLVANVDKGLNAMPAKGMCYDCSADDFKALIEYMSKAK